MNDLYKQAVALQFKFRDYVDEPSSPVAVQIRTGLQRFIDDIELKKNARSLEDRLKLIMRQLDSVVGTPIMDNRHIAELLDKCETILKGIREL